MSRGVFALGLVCAACSSASPEPTSPERMPAPKRQREPSLATSAKPAVLDPERVRFDLDLNELEQCFTEARGPKVAFVRVEWRVDENGHVLDTEVEESTAADPEAEQCLQAKIKTMNFGHPGVPSAARWTFVRGLPKTRRTTHPGVLVEDPADWDERRQSPSTPRIEQTVHAHMGLFGHCFRDALLRKPGQSGITRLRFTIESDGSVSGVADAGSTLKDERVLPCMAEGFYAMRFPPPGQSLRVFYPLEFEGE
jgi:hypothetical protein